MNGLTLLGTLLISLGLPLGVQGYQVKDWLLLSLSVPLLFFGFMFILDDNILHEKFIKRLLRIDE